MLAKDILVKDEVSISPEDDVLDAIYLMLKKFRRFIPVIKDSKFIGTINVNSYSKILGNLDQKGLESMKVSELMETRPRIFPPDTEIKYILDSLCEKGIYGVPIVSGHEYLGMIGRKSVIRRFLPQMRINFKVQDSMAYNVSSCSIHDTIDSMIKKISSGIERRVVVMDGNTVAGSITIQDMINALLVDKADIHKLSVKDIILPIPVTVRKNDDCEKAAKIMLEWQIGGIPVMDEKLEGIIRDKDIIQRFQMQL